MPDTPQQKLALRSNKTAQKVRARFPEGTRVVSLAGMTGTVERHIPALTSLGGTLKIRWDKPMFKGSEVSTVNPTEVRPVTP